GWQSATGGCTCPIWTLAISSDMRASRWRTSRVKRRRTSAGWLESPLQPRGRFPDALADVRRIEHLGLAAVLQDLRHQPAQRAVADGGQRRAVLEHGDIVASLPLVTGARRREQHARGSHLAAQPG